jgi:hypothetical protein
MQCIGCDEILGQEFNLCWNCYTNRNNRSTKDKNNTTNQFWLNLPLLHHTGKERVNVDKPKCTQDGHKSHPVCICPRCSSCLICDDCICHNQYKIRYRFFDRDGLEKLNAAFLDGNIPNGRVTGA